MIEFSTAWTGELESPEHLFNLNVNVFNLQLVVAVRAPFFCRNINALLAHEHMAKLALFGLLRYNITAERAFKVLQAWLQERFHQYQMIFSEL